MSESVAYISQSAECQQSSLLSNTTHPHPLFSSETIQFRCLHSYPFCDVVNKLFDSCQFHSGAWQRGQAYGQSHKENFSHEKYKDSCRSWSDHQVALISASWVKSTAELGQDLRAAPWQPECKSISNQAFLISALWVKLTAKKHNMVDLSFIEHEY